jgi:hypothetical protein
MTSKVIGLTRLIHPGILILMVRSWVFSRHGKISFKSISDILGDAIEEFNLPELNSFKELDDKTEEDLEK